MKEKAIKTDEEWKKELTPEQFAVARQKGTEPAFSGEYHDNKEKGIYKCVCCGTELFGSDTKFDSGTGWPSFHQPMSHENVKSEKDDSHGMRRWRCSAVNATPTWAMSSKTVETDWTPLLHQLGFPQAR